MFSAPVWPFVGQTTELSITRRFNDHAGVFLNESGVCRTGLVGSCEEGSAETWAFLGEWQRVVDLQSLYARPALLRQTPIIDHTHLKSSEELQTLAAQILT